MTIRHLGDWGHLHIVDLSASTVQSSLSERVSRLKKRIASAQYWEKRLTGVKELMADYAVDLVPSPEDVEVREATAGDVLDGASQFLEPIEAALSKHILFKREQEKAIGDMTERMAVLEAVLHPRRGRGLGKTPLSARDRAAEEAKERSELTTSQHPRTVLPSHLPRCAPLIRIPSPHSLFPLTV